MSKNKYGKTCPQCKGERFIKEKTKDGQVIWVTCPYCLGRGKIL